MNTTTIKIFFTVLLLYCSLDCQAIQSRIIGGKKSVNHSYPFMVAIEYEQNDKQFCSGTLIAKNKVLTAAHCVKENELLQVRLGTNNKFKDSGRVIYVSKQIKHPQFNEYTLDYDVAVLTLIASATLSDNINIVGIPQECASLNCQTGLAKANTIVRVIGWGSTSPDGNANNVSADLLEVDIPIISQTACRDVMTDKVSNRMICAGYSKGGKDACIGDSGGPLFGYMESAKMGLQTGIVSWSSNEPCGSQNNYGVYTRLSNYEINRFVRSQISTNP